MRGNHEGYPYRYEVFVTLNVNLQTTKKNPKGYDLICKCG